MSLRTAYPTFFRLVSPPARLAAVRILSFPFRVLFFPFRWWTWRMTRRLVLTSAVLLTLIALTYAVENWRGHRAFAAVVREAAAAGLSFDLRDHAQPPVPDDQNLAKIPLLDSPADAKLRDEFWGELNTRLSMRHQDGTTEPFSAGLPTAGRPNPFENRPADLAATRAENETLLPEIDIETLDACLARLAPLLAELATATAERPHLRYDYEWEKLQAIAIPQVGPLRALARAATLQALVDLENDRPTAAARSLGMPLRLAPAVQRDPLLISQLVAISIDTQAQAVIWQGQLAHRWTTAELDLFAELLAEDQVLDSFRRAYAGEAALGVSILLQLPDSLRNPDQVPTDDSRTLSLRPLIVWAPSGWLHQNAVTMARFYLDEVLPSIDPSAARIHPETFIQRDKHTPRPHPYNAIARIIIPTVHQLSLTVGRAKTSHDLARLAVALEQHLLTRGTYPDSLAPVLADDPALAALHDPFDGQPYHYRRDADGGFTLWGVGENLRDDGGAFAPSRANGIPDHTVGDLVWRVPGP